MIKDVYIIIKHNCECSQALAKLLLM